MRRTKFKWTTGEKDESKRKRKPRLELEFKVKAGWHNLLDERIYERENHIDGVAN